MNFKKMGFASVLSIHSTSKATLRAAKRAAFSALALTLSLPASAFAEDEGSLGDATRQEKREERREQRRNERREAWKTEPRLQGAVTVGGGHNVSVTVDTGEIPTARDVLDTVVSAATGEATSQAGDCLQQNGVSTSSVSDCSGSVGSASASSAQDAAGGVVDSLEQIPQVESADFFRIGAGAKYRLTRTFPLYASGSAEMSVAPADPERPVMLSGVDTALTVGRDAYISLHPISYTSGPSTTGALSTAAIEAGVGNLAGKFEPLYCPEIPIGDHSDDPFAKCMRRYSGEIKPSDHAAFSLGLGGGYANNDTTWLADGRVSANLHVKVNRVEVSAQGYAGMTAGAAGQDVYVAPTVGANLTVAGPRARRSE